MRVAYRRVALPLAGLIPLMSAHPALAETLKSFQVSAVVANGCSVSTTSSGNWGNIDLGTVSGMVTGTVQAGLLASGNAGIQLVCTPGMTVNVTADAGNNAVSGVRQLASGGSRVPYQLYANGSTTPWTTQPIAFAFPVGTSNQLFPVVAKAMLSGGTRAGTYSDTVRVTLSW